MTKATYANKLQRTIASHGGFVVSEGTLRDEDLLERFADTLQLFDVTDDIALCEEALELAEKLECQGTFEDTGFYELQDEASECLEELHDRLNERAPEGYYFGASEGDGACFGFWAYEPAE